MNRTCIVPDFSRETSLREILNAAEHEFPIVVRTCVDSCGIYERTDGESHVVPARTFIKLEKRARVHYARVKVLPRADNEDLARSRRSGLGASRVDSGGLAGDGRAGSSRLEDQEVLVPLNLPHRVNICHRPGRRLRYAVVEQVLQDKPRYVRAETDTMSSPCPGSHQERHIPAGTVLEVRGISAIHYENTDYLECMNTVSKQTYLFRQDAIVNFTAVPDTRMYLLSELVSSVLLPAVVKFADLVKPSDVAFFEDDQSNAALIATRCLLEVLECETKTVLVGLVRGISGHSSTGSAPAHQIVLIPEDGVDFIEVQIKNFATDIEKHKFCAENFSNCSSLDFIHRKVYTVQPGTGDFVFLRDTEDQDNPNEDDDDYVDVGDAPAVPPRTWRQSQAVQQSQNVQTSQQSQHHVQTPQQSLNVHISKQVTCAHTTQPTEHEIHQKLTGQDVVKKIVEKTKLGFGKVHKELMAHVNKSKIFMRPSLLFGSRLPSKLGRASSAEECGLRAPTKRDVVQRSVSESGEGLVKNKNHNCNRPLPPVPMTGEHGDVSCDAMVTSDGYLILSKVDALRDGKPWT